VTDEPTESEDFDEMEMPDADAPLACGIENPDYCDSCQ
jgi:hypothetical protein